MLEQLKIYELNGIWDVSLPMSFHLNGQFPEKEIHSISPECHRVCVPPVKAYSSGYSGNQGMIFLHAHFASEKEARSLETREAFKKSVEKVRDVLIQRQVCAV
jgi:hypothetical protein